MANQYKNALHYAAEELAQECAEADIDFDMQERKIYWRGITKTLPAGTTKQECRRTLRKIIEADKNMKMKETQGALL